MRKPAPLALVFLAVACGSSSSGGGPGNPPPDTGFTDDNPDDYIDPPDSCSFQCTADCEPDGYSCPALGPWDSFPHADACGAYDGTTSSFPTITGQCTVGAPTGEALKLTGVDPDDAGTIILPTGARAKAAGKVTVFDDFDGQFLTNVANVPGTPFAIAIDGGNEEQSVRLIDTNRVGGAGAIIGATKFTGDASVNYGVAVLPIAGGKIPVYVSGGPGSILYAFTIDPAGPTFMRDEANDIPIPHAKTDPDGGGLNAAWMISGLAATPDGKKIMAGTGNAKSGSTPLFVVDVDPTSATYKQVINRVDVTSREIFSVLVHPSDTEGRYAYVSLWETAEVDQIDLQTKTIRPIAVGSYPQAFTPVGPRYLAVVASAGDTISLIDTLPTGGGEIARVPVVTGSKKGWAPSGVAYDSSSQRLYVTLAGENAIEAFDVANLDTTPTLAPAGMVAAQWWPTAITLRDDGSLVVVNGKGKGTGPNPTQFGPGHGTIVEQMHASIQVVPAPDTPTLTVGEAAVDAATNVGALPGWPKVDCHGAPYDFPVPETNTAGPSTHIKHVIFVVKENKTFDGVFGDAKGVNGDPNEVMAPGDMRIFQNNQKIASTFTNFDNYYTSAEQSIQGHIWTTLGRTTEYTERTWLVTWGRGYRPVFAVSVTRPEEGSLFSWVHDNGLTSDVMGETTGLAPGDGDTRYPGGLYNQDVPDTMKSCYIVARARVTCNLHDLVYSVQPNDHTDGLTAGSATPATMIAVGDEGVGVLVEGLSHSPMWADTLVIVTEDDPQDGGDHVDLHRTPLYFAGPWVKRGYVAKGHYDVSSIHKLIANIFGKPYLNENVARAALPLEMFTSTPDYTTFDHVARTEPLACNPTTGAGAAEAAMSHWDLKNPDQAPGIAKQIWEFFHPGGVAPRWMGDGDEDDDDD